MRKVFSGNEKITKNLKSGDSIVYQEGVFEVVREIQNLVSFPGVGQVFTINAQQNDFCHCRVKVRYDNDYAPNGHVMFLDQNQPVNKWSWSPKTHSFYAGCVRKMVENMYVSLRPLLGKDICQLIAKHLVCLVFDDYAPKNCYKEVPKCLIRLSKIVQEIQEVFLNMDHSEVKTPISLNLYPATDREHAHNKWLFTFWCVALSNEFRIPYGELPILLCTTQSPSGQVIISMRF